MFRVLLFSLISSATFQAAGPQPKRNVRPRGTSGSTFGDAADWACPIWKSGSCSPTSMATVGQMFVEGEEPESIARCRRDSVLLAISWRNTTSPMPRAGTSLQIMVRAICRCQRRPQARHMRSRKSRKLLRVNSRLGRSTADQAGSIAFCGSLSDVTPHTADRFLTKFSSPPNCNAKKRATVICQTTNAATKRFNFSEDP